jgi:hypothetical protein
MEGPAFLTAVLIHPLKPHACGLDTRAFGLLHVTNRRVPHISILRCGIPQTSPSSMLKARRKSPSGAAPNVAEELGSDHLCFFARQVVCRLDLSAFRSPQSRPLTQNRVLTQTLKPANSRPALTHPFICSSSELAKATTLYPQSTYRTSPLMPDESSEAKNSAALPTSAGSTFR